MLTRRRGYLQWRDDAEVPPESRQLQYDGWTLLAGVFSDAEVEVLATDMTRVFDEFPPDARRPERLATESEQFRYEMVNRSAPALAAVANRRILDVVEPLIGEDCHIIANTAWRNPPAIEHTHGGGRWHIDAGPHVPHPIDVEWDDHIPHPVFVVAAHILVQDCPLACGPTGVIPRSHTSGQPPPADRPLDPDLTCRGQGPVTLEARAGDVQLFVSDVWHRRMPTGPGDAGRFFLQVHYGRRDIAQRLRTTEMVNQLSDESRAWATDERTRQLLGLHKPFFYDG